MSNLPRTPAEAISLGLTRYFTGKPCKHGHVAERYARAGSCVECAREASRKWREDNPDKDIKRVQKWRVANPEKAREASRRNYAKNPEMWHKHSLKWHASNREKSREQSRKWSARNPQKRAAYHAARRARKLTATPPWADMAAIEAIYAERVRVTADTGIEHHVDHIVPLQGKNVCGLHVPWNLRVVTAAENYAKGAKMT